jgi:hypothetical protein
MGEAYTMNARQEALLERAVELLEALAKHAAPPPRRRMADVPDLVTADNRTSARLEADRREHERIDGLVPDSPESYRRQHDRMQAEFDRLRRDVRRYEDKVDSKYGDGASRDLPWNWVEEGQDPYNGGR